MKRVIFDNKDKIYYWCTKKVDWKDLWNIYNLLNNRTFNCDEWLWEWDIEWILYPVKNFLNYKNNNYEAKMVLKNMLWDTWYILWDLSYKAYQNNN